MSLPFRRRHNDAEASHDRARTIIAMGFLEPAEPADEAWLENHLAGCGECRAELEAWGADREELRGLRAAQPEPPRDLWARTAASIEREAGRHDRAARSPRATLSGPRIGRLPLGVLSGVVVVLVVVATSLWPRNVPMIEPSAPPNSQVANVTPRPEVTPVAVTARAVTWVEEQGDGTFELHVADVAEVCVSNPDACAPIEDQSTTRLTLDAEPESVAIAPQSDQIVVVTAASERRGGEVIVVPVTTPTPTLTPGSTPTPEPTPSPTPAPPSPTPTLGPGETVGPTGIPIPTPNPDGSFSILSGVVVVGETAYSADGAWLAFSARPVDGTQGPDLYVWRVGEPFATAATSDHRTFFAGWLGNVILASRIVTADAVPGESPVPSLEPGTTAAPAATPDTTPKPGRTPKPGQTAAPTVAPDGSPIASPNASPDGSPMPAEDHPVSFLLDPVTSTVVDLAGDDIWRPVVDPATRTIVYWSGTLVPDADGTGWELGTGRLVLDGWVDPAVTPDASPDPGATADPTPTATPTAAASVDPLATASPTPPPGPAGTPTALTEGPVSDFDISFDPTGTRLAIWIRDPANADIGTLRLVVLDPETGAIVPDVDPLPAAPALRGFSMAEGRLAWVTPPGQDGEASHVHVLAWTADDFGQVRSFAADRLVVVR